MDTRISAKLTYLLLLLDKATETINEIKKEIGATHTEIDLIFAKVPFSVNYTSDNKNND